jgi:D-amino peptidase
MRYLVLTDLEGVAGIDSWAHTRSTDDEKKAPAMAQLAREVNACVEGIRSVHPDADIDVWDGHGYGGLHEGAVVDAQFRDDERPYYDLDEYDALLFVGQHAMAGTVLAPLAHTYDSRNVAYYRLNGFYIGEFGARALVAGRQAVPTIYLSGDDKAAREAELFVPDIETTVTKRGTGLEAADHLDPEEASRRIHDDTATAVRRVDEVDAFDGISPPYRLEIRFTDPISDDAIRTGDDWSTRPLRRRGDFDVLSRIDERTIFLETDDIVDLPL